MIRAILLVLGMLATGGCQLPPDANSDTDSDRKILVLHPGQPSPGMVVGSGRYGHGLRYNQVPIHIRAALDRMSDRHDIVELESWPIGPLDAYCTVFRLQPSQDMERLLEQLSRSPDVLLAQPMNQFRALAAEPEERGDPYADIQYGSDLAHIKRLHAHTRGENVRVGVVDSEVDATHPDLRGQVTVGARFVGDTNHRGQLHGTAVAGIIAARDGNGEGGLGLAPRAELFSYSACEADQANVTLCSTFDLARALTRAIEDRLDIVNLSLAGPRDPLIGRLVERALADGIIVIAAADPSRPDTSFPASLPGVVAVGVAPASGVRHASDTTDIAPWFWRTERFSTRAGGGYQFFYGTSVATAGVSGLAALVHSRVSRSQTRVWLAALSRGECKTLPGEAFAQALQQVLGCDPDLGETGGLLSRSTSWQN